MKTLIEIHEDVSAEHYDIGIKKNLFQKYWHGRRFSEVLKLLKSTNGPILDVGCHSGTFTEKILKKINSRKVYGIDVSPSAISLAKKRLPYGNFQVADAVSLPFKNNFFDLVVCLEVLEHVDDPVKVISEISRVLKKGGSAVILVPTDNNLFRIVWLLWTLYYPVWRHAHVQSFRKSSLEKAIVKGGLKIDKVKLFNLRMLKLIVAHK